MSLGDVVIETREVPVGESSFAVRGLSLRDVAVVIDGHLKELEALFKKFQEGAESADEEQAAEDLLRSALVSAPEMLAKAIALAADSPELVDKCLRLDVGVQITALQNVWELTVKGSGGSKKFIERLTELVQSARPLVLS